jgi:hypothetical protein
MNLTVTGLLILVLVQWGLLTFLIISQYHQWDSFQTYRKNSATQRDQEALSSQSEGNNGRMPKTSEGEQNIRAINEFTGVASTIMLNSPKWFQRRYCAMVSNILVNLPPDWAVQIFYVPSGQSQFGLDINPGVTRLVMTYPERIFLTELSPALVKQYGVRKSKSSFWSSAWMWEHMLADRVFVFSGNGALCTNSKKLSFLDGSTPTRAKTKSHGLSMQLSLSSSAMQLFETVDYIGTPWRLQWGKGGDGSISYRNRTVMLEAIRYKENESKEREDSYFVKTILEMNTKLGSSFRLASKEQTEIFGGTSDFTEETGPPLVIGGTLGRLEHNVREEILAHCPELKLIFPVLHNPNCFGAKPSGEECAKHICALQDRNGGC